MARRRKRSESEEELMTETNIQRVIRLLEPTEEGVKPITKKDACQILGMSYNTTRLATIIQQYKDQKTRERQRRSEKRGKPLEPSEIHFIISEYLEGSPVDAISKSIYRSTHTIKQVLEEYSVPVRVAGHSYFKPQLIPDGAVRDKFGVGEVVYSARYDSLAKILTEKLDPKHGWIYGIWLMSEKWKQNAYQPAYELASLQHLREVGVAV